MGSAAALPGQPSRNALKILLLFLVIYSLTWAGHYTTGDGAQKVAWAKSMFLRQSADIGPGFRFDPDARSGRLTANTFFYYR